MTDHSRYTSREFPPYAHLPGVTPHPKKAQGHSEGIPDPESVALEFAHWQQHQDYLYAVDLHNAGFYWEAHVWWEAVWKACPKGRVRDFVQGLIKVEAAALKLRMKQEEIAYDHAKRAHELMSGCFANNETQAFGVSRFWWNNIIKNPQTRLELVENE